MPTRLDSIMYARGITNQALARRLKRSSHYISAIRNGARPALPLATRICELFPGEITLADLGFRIPVSLVGGGAA